MKTVKWIVLVGLFSLPGTIFAAKPTTKAVTNKGVPIPPARPGKGKMLDWTLYKRVHITPKKAQHIGLDQSTPAKLAVSFMASVVRGDKEYMKLVSPNMKAAVRKRFATSTFKGIKGIKQLSFFLSATISTKQARKKRGFGGITIIVEKLFGTFQEIVLLEGPTTRHDHFVYAEKIKGKWYVKGVTSKLLVWLDPYIKATMNPTKPKPVKR